jgi:hypothetical protein
VSYGRSRGRGRLLRGAQPVALSEEDSSFVITETLMCDEPAKKSPFTIAMHTSVMVDLVRTAAHGSLARRLGGLSAWPRAPSWPQQHGCVLHCAPQEPGEAYEYSLGGVSFSFRAPLSVGSTQPFSFFGFGDMGESKVKGRKNPM